jgi:hypothetical protein
MKWMRRNIGRPHVGLAGMEIAAALSAASQMALLYPPGCDEWLRRELAGEEGAGGTSRGRDRLGPR